MSQFAKLFPSQESSSDLKRYWMPDKACKECSECGAKFNWFLRRHHCRICGRIFCNTCCSLTIQGDLLRRDLQVSLYTYLAKEKRAGSLVTIKIQTEAKNSNKVCISYSTKLYHSIAGLNFVISVEIYCSYMPSSPLESMSP